jgi:hypothetical protein
VTQPIIAARISQSAASTAMSSSVALHGRPWLVKFSAAAKAPGNRDDAMSQAAGGGHADRGKRRARRRGLPWRDVKAAKSSFCRGYREYPQTPAQRVDRGSQLTA